MVRAVFICYFQISTTLIEPQIIIGDYELYNVIGKGNFASVWYGMHQTMKYPVAVKRFSKQERNAPEIMATTQREVMIMSMIDHPLIAQLYQVLEDEKYVYIVMEYAERGTLMRYVNQNGPLPEEEARRIFIEIIAILQYLHSEKRIIHRDLKAENILLDKNNHVKLIDFGLSNVLNHCDVLNTVCGSPAYVAPEILNSRPYSQAADIWSAGVLLFAISARCMPFNDSNMSCLIQKILTQEPQMPAKFSPGLADLISQMLKKNPDERITQEGIKMHPWVCQFNTDKPISFNFMALSKAKIGADRIDFQPDPQILQMIESYGLDASRIREDLIGNRNTREAAAYKALYRAKVNDMLPSIIEQIYQLDTRKSNFMQPSCANTQLLLKLPSLTDNRTTSQKPIIPGRFSSVNLLLKVPSKGTSMRTLIQGAKGSDVRVHTFQHPQRVVHNPAIINVAPSFKEIPE